MDGTCTDEVFASADGSIILRDTAESMASNTFIYSNVIDAWTSLLNHEKQLRSSGSIRRLFFHTTIIQSQFLILDNLEEWDGMKATYGELPIKLTVEIVWSSKKGNHK